MGAQSRTGNTPPRIRPGENLLRPTRQWASRPGGGGQALPPPTLRQAKPPARFPAAQKAGYSRSPSWPLASPSWRAAGGDRGVPRNLSTARPPGRATRRQTQGIDSQADPEAVPALPESPRPKRGPVDVLERRLQTQLPGQRSQTGRRNGELPGTSGYRTGRGGVKATGRGSCLKGAGPEE